MKNNLRIALLPVFWLLLALARCNAQGAPEDIQKQETMNQAEGTPDTMHYINSDEKAYYGPIFHKVEEGETVESIVKRFNMTMDDFKGWNYLPNGLKPGINVVIKFARGNQPELVLAEESKKAPQPVKNNEAGAQYHVVVAGETLYHLSVVYHVTVQQLKDWNKLSDNTVAVGQNLRVGK